MAIYSTDFAKVFSKLVENYSLSSYQISQFSGLDQAYLSRLKSGERKNPSPETVVKIALAICHTKPQAKLSDIEELFNATGRSLTSH
jgi:transcriptional regulator with XRE-family HTH domain